MICVRNIRFKNHFQQQFNSLIPSVPVYDIFVLWNHALTHYFRATLRLHNSPGNCVRKLFKSLKDVASLLDWIERNWKVLDFSYVGDGISWVGFCRIAKSEVKYPIFLFPTPTFQNFWLWLFQNFQLRFLNIKGIWMLKSMEIMVHSKKPPFQQKFQKKLYHFNRNS